MELGGLLVTGLVVRAMALLGSDPLVCKGGEVLVRAAPVAGSMGCRRPICAVVRDCFPLREAERLAARATGKKASALGSQSADYILR